MLSRDVTGVQTGALPIWTRTQGLTVAVDPEGWLVKLKLTVPVGGLLVPLAVSVTVTVQPSGLLAEVVAGQSSTVVVERVVTITVSLPSEAVDRKSTRLNSSHITMSYAVVSMNT